MLKMIISILILLFSGLVLSQETEVKETNLEVAIGIDEIKKFDYKFNNKFQIGNQSILKLIAVPSKREITFRGVQAGKTSVTIRDGAGDIRDKFIVNVTSDGKSQVVMELRQLIGDIEGIDIVIRGGKVIVEGELVVPSDIGRISIILGKYPEVIRLIELSPHTQRTIARKMQEEINRNGMKDVTVRIVNRNFWLEGVVNSASKKDLAKAIATEYIPNRIESLGVQGSSNYSEVEKGIIQDFITVNEKKDPEPPPKLVKIAAQFVELTKDYAKIFGFNWNPLMSQGGSVSFGRTSEGGIATEESGTLSGTISNLFPRLSSAKAAGYARIIQSGMGVVEDKQKLAISKERTVPFSNGGGEFSQAAEAKFGFNLSVTPEVGDKEMVKLQGLEVRVTLNAGDTGAGNPQSSTNTINTHVVIKSKQSAVIGGIVQSSSTTNYDKDVPGGAVQTQDEATFSLFNLIRSKNYSTEKSQFVVFVTPEIIESASAGTEEVRKKFRKRQR